MITTGTDTHSETKPSCINCREMQNDMLHATQNPHVMLEPTYQKLKSMYEAKKLDLVISDCSFKHFMEEVEQERHYTYQAYLKCPECDTFFQLGVCVRGTPLYKMANTQPDIEKIEEIAKRDNKTIYRG